MPQVQQKKKKKIKFRSTQSLIRPQPHSLAHYFFRKSHANLNHLWLILAAMAGKWLQQRWYGLKSLKSLLSKPLQKKFSDLYHGVYIPHQVTCQSHSSAHMHFALGPERKPAWVTQNSFVAVLLPPCGGAFQAMQTVLPAVGLNSTWGRDPAFDPSSPPAVTPNVLARHRETRPL